MSHPIPRYGEGGTLSHDWTDNRKNLMLFSGRAHPELAEQVAKELDVHVTAQTAREFANGEIFVRFDESVRGCDAFVLQSCPAPVNRWLMESLIMIDALKRGSAKRITAVMPFYPYARQDKKHRGRAPISARAWTRALSFDFGPAWRPLILCSRLLHCAAVGHIIDELGCDAYNTIGL